MKTIRPAHFCEWLFSQPPTRKFYWLGGDPDSEVPCLFAAYAKDTGLSFNRVDDRFIYSVASGDLAIGPLSEIPIPLKMEFTALEAQEECLRLFPKSKP